MAGATLKEKGWHLTEEGIEQCKQNGRTDVESIIRTALDTDLREIGQGWLPEEINRGKADYLQAPGVLQLQKIRNVSAPKDNEDSQLAPRLMKLVLTDGHTTCSAIETEVLKDIGSNTPPGSKIKLRLTADVEHGFLLLNNKNMQYLGGRVVRLAESWELKKKLAKQQRTTFLTEGGPPPFVPFGQRIDKSQFQMSTRRDNFKSLEVSKGDKKPEDAEFEQQRKATIAEALQAKEDTQSKKFGGQKQYTDQDVAKICEMGFRADEAVSALKQNNGNMQQALDHLLGNSRGGAYTGGGGTYGRGRDQGFNRTTNQDGDRGRGRRDRRDEDGGDGGRRGRDKGDESTDARPSAPATLFDFLETKITTKGPKKDEKSTTSSSQKQSSSKFDDDKPSSKSYHNDNSDSNHRQRNSNSFSDSQSQYNRPKTTQNIPPRFVKPKPEASQGQGQSKGQGRYSDDKGQRSERSNDSRAKTAPSEQRNYENRNYNDRNSDRDRDRNYNNTNDRRHNDQGESKGNYSNRNNSYDNRGNNNYNSKQSASERGYNRDEPSSRDSRQYDNHQQNKSKPSQQNYTSSSRAKNEYNGDKSSNYSSNDRSRDSRPNYNSQNSNNSQDSYSSGNKNEKSSGYSSDNYQKGKKYGANNNYSNQGNSSYGNQGNQSQRPSNYGNNQGPPINTDRQINTQPQYQQPQQQQQMVYTEPNQFPYNLKPGDKVMAKYWEDHNYYECVIEGLAPNLPTCVVTYLEYGNTEEVMLSDIRQYIPQIPQQQLVQPDMSVPPPQMFFSGPAITMTTGVDDVTQGIQTMEFRRGGAGPQYRKDGRPQQQLYQPPGQRR